MNPGARRQSLRNDDRVLSWIRGKYDGGAIPYRWFLVPYRVISDTYGVFVYDADADFVRGFPASLDYRFHGWRNGVMVMQHKDGTLFDCLTGMAFDGPRKGEQLTPIPTIETDWGPWLAANPGTVAYAMVPKFQPQSIPQVLLAESRKTRPAPDARLGAEKRVFGLTLDGSSRAWPLKSFGKGPELRVATFGDKKAVILWDGRTRTAAAYAPQTEESPSQNGAAHRRAEQPGGAVGGHRDRIALVDRRSGGFRSAQGADPALASGRDGQVVRVVGEYPKTSLEGGN